MKRWLAFLVFLTVNCYAQFDTGSNSLNIPPSANPSTPPPKLTPPKKDPFYVPPSIKGEPSGNSSGLLYEDDKIDFSAKKPQFDNPGKEVQDKLNKRGEGDMYQVLRRNQYLGDFRTKTSLVTVQYRDHEAVDGDQIRVWVNGKVVKQLIYLTGDYGGLDIPLQPGFNNIEFEALNQGMSGPNTAEFKVYDQDNKLISANRWDLATGFKASIIIVKE